MLWATQLPAVLKDYPSISSVVRFVINGLAKGKTAHSDGIVAEMLMELDDTEVDMLSDIFECRILNIGATVDDDVWQSHVVRLIQKSSGATQIDKYRSIALLQMLKKVYTGVVLKLIGPCVYDLNVENFAFRPGYQAHEVVSLMRLAIEKSLEWDLPLCMLDGDISKAYDSCEYWLIIKGLKERKVPKFLIAAIMREVMGVVSTFVINQEATSDPIKRSRSLMQGGTADPALFNVALDVVASRFRKLAQRKGWGFKLGDNTCIDIIIYADNYWLLAKTPQELQDMTNAWLDILNKHGFNTPPL